MSMNLGGGRALKFIHSDNDNKDKDQSDGGPTAELTMFNEEFKDKSTLRVVQDLKSRQWLFETTFNMPDLFGEDQINIKSQFDPKKLAFKAASTEIAVDYSTEKYPIGIKAEVSAKSMGMSGVYNPGKYALGLSSGLDFDSGDTSYSDNLRAVLQYEDDDQCVAAEYGKLDAGDDATKDLRIGIARTIKQDLEVAAQVTLKELKTPKVQAAFKMPQERVGEVMCSVSQDDGLKARVGPVKPLAFMAASMSLDLGWFNQCKLGFDVALNESD
jgi:hypothetical protein